VGVAALGPMPEPVTVALFGALRTHANGASEVQVDARTIRELLADLARAYPGMAPQLERGISVSIDGRIYTESLFERIGPENEVVLLPRVAGG
jgi:sulfur-carrier protein